MSGGQQLLPKGQRLCVSVCPPWVRAPALRLALSHRRGGKGALPLLFKPCPSLPHGLGSDQSRRYGREGGRRHSQGARRIQRVQGGRSLHVRPVRKEAQNAEP